MKVLHLNYRCDDGAGRAVNRIHRALLEQGVESRFVYLRPHDPSVSPFSSLGQKVNGFHNILIGRLTHGDMLRGFLSLNLFQTKLLEEINNSDVDIVHLHWIHGEMMSISQVAQINKPIVWTFHDMWPFCGSAHWVESDRDEQFYIQGYEKRFPTRRFAGIDLDRWAYKRKEKYWKKLRFHIATPSNWMAKCVSQSALFRNRPVEVVPNCLDLSIFRPLENKEELRRSFGLPDGKRIILYGATQPGALRKGGDLIESILSKLPDKKDYVLAIFGTASRSMQKSADTNCGVQTFELGFIRDEQAMVNLYNAADVMCVPSRLDNLPSVCVEAIACGLPVAAFRVGGIPDIIEHKVTGYLANPFDLDDFCTGIVQLLETSASDHENVFRTIGPERARANFSNQIVAEKHINLYKTVLDG